MSIESRKKIRNVIESWATAIRSGNIEDITANHTEDILMFDVPKPLQSRGMEAYKKT